MDYSTAIDPEGRAWGIALFQHRNEDSNFTEPYPLLPKYHTAMLLTIMTMFLKGVEFMKVSK